MYTDTRVMSWRRVAKSVQAVVAHALLFSFVLLFLLKLDHSVQYRWWVIFAPLWLFHAVVARGRFSLPAPALPHDRHWAPYHAVMATPLFVSFELLLCLHLDRTFAVDLKILFLPILAFEIAVLVDNIRMCRALMPGDDESLTDDAIWATLPHFWVAISMVFCIAATTFTLLKLCGDVTGLTWWDLFINYGIAECFAFLVCTKWDNPAIHGHSYIREAGPSSMAIRYIDWERQLIVSSEEDQNFRMCCSLQEIGGHIMKIPIVVFQILLIMRLEGTPRSAKQMPLPVVFTPLLLVQGAGLLFAAYRLIEKIVFMLHSGDCSSNYFLISSKIRDCFGFLHHGSRLIGWWSIDEASQQERARLFCSGSSGFLLHQQSLLSSLYGSDRSQHGSSRSTFNMIRNHIQACELPQPLACELQETYINVHHNERSYNTFSPDVVKKLPKSDLVEEIGRLQAALSEQTEVTKRSQQEYERLQNEKILCRVCFEDQINVVMLPCRHHALCRSCCNKCKKCPICRVSIEGRLPVAVHEV